MGSPLPPHCLIFEKIENFTAVPDMAPEPDNMLANERTRNFRLQVHDRQLSIC